MFVLSEIADTVPLAPNTFNIDRAITLKDALNKKYSNHLIPNVGLGLSVYDLLTCGEGKVRWGDGLVWYRVTFRLVVFAPHVQEILVGRVLSQNAEQVRVSLDFFTDVYIPAAFLNWRTVFNREENKHVYTWEPPPKESDSPPPPPNPNEPPVQPLEISVGDSIRFRVVSLEWQEVEPLPPSVRNKPPPLDAEGKEILPTPQELEMKQKEREKQAGLRVIVSAIEG